MDTAAFDPTSPGVTPTEPDLTEPDLTEPDLTEPDLTEPDLTESEEQAVIRLEAERYAAMVAADWGRFAELCDPELLYTHSSGQTDTLDEYLAKVAAGIFVYHRIDHPIEKVLVRGDVAIVLGEMNAHITSHGAEKDLRNKCLAVWTRNGKNWRLIAYQPTPFA